MTESIQGSFAVELEERLSRLLGSPVRVRVASQAGGGASKEAWAVDLETENGRLELLVRRAGGGATYTDMLSLESEHRLLEMAFRQGIKAPRPYGYIPDLAGRAALVMERVRGETIGRRIVRSAGYKTLRAALPRQMAEHLASIHSASVEHVDFLPGPRNEPVAPGYLDRLEEQLDTLLEPHPVIELGLRHLRTELPPEHGVVLSHGDFRLGNFVVDREGIVAVLDWEYAHCGHPGEDLGWALVRAWRFGMPRRVAGVGDVGPYLDRYNELTGYGIVRAELAWWELAGNVRWAIGAARQGLRHLSGQERSVELAVIARLAAEIEYEILNLLRAV